MKKGGGAPVFSHVSRIVTALWCPRCPAACWRTASAVHCQSGEGNRLLWRSELDRERSCPTMRCGETERTQQCRSQWRHLTTPGPWACRAPISGSRSPSQSPSSRLGGWETLCGRSEVCQSLPVQCTVPLWSRPPGPSSPPTRLRPAMRSPAAKCRAGGSARTCMRRVRCSSCEPHRQGLQGQPELAECMQRVRGRWQAFVRQELTES